MERKNNLDSKNKNEAMKKQRDQEETTDQENILTRKSRQPVCMRDNARCCEASEAVKLITATGGRHRRTRHSRMTSETENTEQNCEREAVQAARFPQGRKERSFP